MPTSLTVTDVYNRALDIVVEFPVEGPDDPGQYARWLRRNYTPTVQSALRQQPWNFACEVFILNELPDAPKMRWRFQYDLPNGWLRVLQPTRTGYRDGFPVPYAVQGNMLMTNERLPKGVELVMDRQSPGTWDPLFADFIAGRLATGMAHRFTAKNSFVQTAKQIADEAYAMASEINTFEGSLPPPEQADILRTRSMDYDWDEFDGRYRY